MNNFKLSLTATSPLSQWLSYLEQSHFKAIDLGLERIKSVAQQLDLLNPAPFVITVGGTNGKGTTCRLLEQILLNAGYRVGVYSSPHLIRYNERVRIQNQELPDEQHSASFAFIEQNKTQSLTYFEYSTLSALYLFKQAKLDVVILEVGLGGRLDATNIVDSDIAVITSIDIDHTDFLGNTREQIAFEKAGIFRANKPAIIGEPNVPNTMLEQAQKRHCQLSRRGVDWTFSQTAQSWQWQREHCHNQESENKKVRLENLPFPHIPLANAATALAVLPYLPFHIAEQHIREALQNVQLTGRFQSLESKQRQGLAKLLHCDEKTLPQVIVDVGHNPHAAKYLAEKLTALKKPTQRILAVCGILKDKDAQGVFSPLLDIIDEWHCVSLSVARGQRSDELLIQLNQLALSQGKKINASAEISMTQALQSAVQNSQENDVLLVFGSFYTVGQLLALLA
ncbi:bifunctional tetrahydrofolate synthase/dihydrofolate synthase [Avibacterium sp. 20-15]|uniref:bifunctional tetrahydrofolate synthase/dihydrofolate synthase n=1 Tax=unclassified Avibacterium TaxID=2685287 RepID=UPI002026C711|nr:MULTISPECIES: bifunctional tetrahydrofolate synthase/dihydrofolate synthase [unclassified Avibacterium]MCW9733766.1 bifunctional tetrahydrofolate synthase/dihydrofolate synthase [Avibacterium sp. 20-15]URL04066.1 bifunctional tetrahydrofolate synthase/dihydrofolate synthase [Avibacterium sp. 20-132]